MASEYLKAVEEDTTNATSKAVEDKTYVSKAPEDETASKPVGTCVEDETHIAAVEDETYASRVIPEDETGSKPVGTCVEVETHASQYLKAVEEGQLQKVKELLIAKKVQVDTVINQVIIKSRCMHAGPPPPIEY